MEMEVLSAKQRPGLDSGMFVLSTRLAKLAQVTAEMRRYKLYVLVMSESRWTVSGRQTTTTGETVLYSGREDNQRHAGVAMTLRKEMEKSLLAGFYSSSDFSISFLSVMATPW